MHEVLHYENILEIDSHSLELELYLKMVMIYGQHQFGKTKVLSAIISVLFSYIILSIMIHEFMESVRLFQYKVCIPHIFCCLNFCKRGVADNIGYQSRKSRR